MQKTYDRTIQEFITTPERMVQFFTEIDNVCHKYGLVISHEDQHGGFIIEKYNVTTIEWLEMASKGYVEEHLKHKPISRSVP
jgi:hypothetical protein